MRYAWIDEARHSYPLAMLCRLLRTSRSGYLVWADGKPLSARELENEQLLVAIRAAHAKGRGHYGPEKIRTELQAQGITAGLNRIKRLRKQHGIRCAREEVARHHRFPASSAGSTQSARSAV